MGFADDFQLHDRPNVSYKTIWKFSSGSGKKIVTSILKAFKRELIMA